MGGAGGQWAGGPEGGEQGKKGVERGVGETDTEAGAGGGGVRMQGAETQREGLWAAGINCPGAR